MRGASLGQRLRAVPGYDVVVEMDHTSYWELEVVIDESLQIARIRVLDTWKKDE